MRKIILSAVCALCFGALQVNAQWTNVGTAGFSAGDTEFPSLAFNSTGEPYVAYMDGANSNKSTVMKFDGTTWVNVGTAGFSAGMAYYTSLALHPTSGEPYVAYRDYGNSWKATVMKFDGTAWVNVGTAGFSADAASYTSLAFHPTSGEPYVAYMDGANSNKSTVMKFDGTTWVNVGSVGFSADVATYTSLAFHPTSGEPYVAYRDEANSDKATVMKYNGTAWVNVGSAGFSAGQASLTSLAFHPTSGEPYVAYVDEANSWKATVMKFDGTDWVNVGTAGFSADAANNTSLAFHPTSGEPYVAYLDFGNASKATVMRFDGTTSTWVNVGSAGFSAGQVSLTSLAFHPTSGEPYVAYRDEANSAKATVMKFVDNTATTYSINTSANPSAGGTVTGGGSHDSGTTVTLTATANTGYQFVKWTESGVEVSTANPYTFTASADRTLVAEFELTTGINEVANANILGVYPNPTNSTLNIEVKETANIKIVNMLGATVAIQQLNAGNNSIDVSTLTKGIYFIQSSNGGAVKFVKE